MGEIKVRRVEDWIIDEFRRRAERSGQSVEDEVRRVIEADMLNARRDVARESESRLRAQHEFALESEIRLKEMRAKYGNDFDSVALIRAVRDEE